MRMSGAWQEWDTTAWTAAKSWCNKWEHKIVNPGESNCFSSIKWQSKEPLLKTSSKSSAERRVKGKHMDSPWKMQSIWRSMSERGCSGRAGGTLVKQLWLPLLTFSLQWHHPRSPSPPCVPWCTQLPSKLSKGWDLCRSFSSSSLTKLGQKPYSALYKRKCQLCLPAKSNQKDLTRAKIIMMLTLVWTSKNWNTGENTAYLRWH